MRAVKILTGNVNVAAAGTAKILTQTAAGSAIEAGTYAKMIVFQAIGTHGVVIGDSSVLWGTSATRRGTVVSDGAGAATTINEVTLIAPGAQDATGRFVEGGPAFDLSEIYVDVETNGDDLWWTAYQW